MPKPPRRAALRIAVAGIGEVARKNYLPFLAGQPEVRIVHPHTFKTHRLVPTPEGLALTRILFDCGFQAIS